MAKANVKPIKPAASAALAAAPAPAPAAEAAPAKKRRKSKFLMPLLGLLLLTAAGAGVWFVKLRHTLFVADAPVAGASGAPASRSAGKKATTFVSLEMFTVNLLDDERERYLQLGVVLEISDGATVDAVKQRMPIIRSQILLLLSNKHSAELLGTQAKEALARDILERARRAIDSPMPDKGIEQAHFSAFVIQ